MADLDTLRPEVKAAIETMDRLNTVNGSWNMVRAELLRLAKENADLLSTIELDEQVWVQRDETMHRWIERARNAEAELAALRARIADAPVVACPKTLVHAGNTMQTEFLEYTHERMPGGCNSWAGKRVRLVVEE